MVAHNRYTWAAGGSDGSEQVQQKLLKSQYLYFFIKLLFIGLFVCMFIYLFSTIQILSIVIPRTTWGQNSADLSCILSVVSGDLPSRVVGDI